MSNYLIVESENDKLVFEALIRHTNLNNIIIPTPFEYRIGSLDSNPEKPTKLIENLKNIKEQIGRGNVDKIGIIFDLDTKPTNSHIELINNAVKQAYDHTGAAITEINQFIPVTVVDETIHIACHFININGKGEIEDLLKTIKTQESPFADCLYEGWKNCLEQKGKTIHEKRLVKQWLSFYIRYDALTKQEMRDAEANTQLENFLKLIPAKFNFDNKDVPELEALKDFLKMFT